MSELICRPDVEFTCDHILELNLLKLVINYEGGACDAAEAIEDEVDRKARLDKVSFLRIP